MVLNITHGAPRASAPCKQDQKVTVQPVVAINVRLKQMRELGRRRERSAFPLNRIAWLEIYAEGLARRYDGIPLLLGPKGLYESLKEAKIAASEEEIADAVDLAKRAYEADPTRSAYSTIMISQRLRITLKERMTFASHLGCAEETAADRDARRKAEKTARNAARPKRQKVSMEQQAKELGVSRRTLYRMKKHNSKATDGTVSEPTPLP